MKENEDRKAIQILIHHGWKSVNIKPNDVIVDICTFYCDEIYFGKAEYRNGSYWSGSTMLDTPSFWRN